MGPEIAIEIGQQGFEQKNAGWQRQTKRQDRRWTRRGVAFEEPW